MKIFKFDCNNFPDIHTKNLCIGKFDGIHKGHEALISQGNSSILTFAPLPYIFFGKSRGVQEKLIYTHEEKYAIFQNFGIKNLLILEFNHALANLNGSDFLEKLQKITEKITVGVDFRFGKNRSHGVEDIETFGIKTNIIEPINDDFGKISSSFLRKCVEKGDFLKYAEISNIPFHLTAKVIHGQKIAGKSLKTPTANMVFPENKISPPFGVYATTTQINGQNFPSISNFGIKPTFENTSQPLLETHIFNFSQNIYNMEAKISFFEKVREEKQFSSINELHFQIMQDIQTTKKIHGIL
jgi:riboflavin kinase/FMN adenylyltransferase